MTEIPRYCYVVTHPFAEYQRGDHITNPDEIAKWEKSHANFMVRKIMTEADDPLPLAAPPPD